MRKRFDLYGAQNQNVVRRVLKLMKRGLKRPEARRIVFNKSRLNMSRSEPYLTIACMDILCRFKGRMQHARYIEMLLQRSWYRRSAILDIT